MFIFPLFFAFVTSLTSNVCVVKNSSVLKERTKPSDYLLGLNFGIPIERIITFIRRGPTESVPFVLMTFSTINTKHYYREGSRRFRFLQFCFLFSTVKTSKTT